MASKPSNMFQVSFTGDGSDRTIPINFGTAPVWWSAPTGTAGESFLTSVLSGNPSAIGDAFYIDGPTALGVASFTYITLTGLLTLTLDADPAAGGVYSVRGTALY